MKSGKVWKSHEEIMEKSCKFIGQNMQEKLTFNVFNVIFIYSDWLWFYFIFISIVLTLACARMHICLCCANVLYTAASLKVKLQCSNVENNPIRVWESVILCNPSTAMKNRSFRQRECPDIDTAALTNNEKNSWLYSITSTVNLYWIMNLTGAPHFTNAII